MAKENAKKDNKKDSKNKKHFWKDFKAELKKVIWPTPKQLFKNTVAVVFIVIVTSAIVFVLDVAFDALNTYGINRFKSAVTNSTSINETIDEETNEITEESEVESNEIETETEVETVEE